VAEETPRNPALNEQLLDASLDGVLAFDRECRYTAWNRAMERISGLRREQVIGRVAFEVFPFLRETGEDRCFYDALAGIDCETAAQPYAVPESGRRGFFDGHYSPLRDERGRVVGGVGVIRDMTARKQAEDALREGEERYRAFIANSSEGIWRFELERPVPTNLTADEQIELFYQYGYLAECNDAMARMYGYARASEIVGARLGDMLVRTDPANVEYLRAFVDSGYRLTEVESVERDRAGQLKYFSNSLVGVVEAGAILRAWGTQRDVTAGRLAENLMRESQERLRRTQQAARLGTFDWDLTTGAVTWSDGIYELLGLAPGSFEPSFDRWLQFVVPEDVAATQQTVREAVAKGGDFAAEFRVRRSDGAVRWVAAIGRVESDAGRAPRRLLGVNIDITDRKLVEEELRRSEERYRSLLENANDIIYSHDLAGNYLAINKACEEITGYTRHEILNGLNIAQVVAPDHLELAKRMTEQKLRDPSPTVYEVDILTKDRRRLTLEVSTRISYRDGRPVAVEGIARDVTERRRAEEERRQLLAREREARREAEDALRAQEEVERSLTLLVEASGVILGSPSLGAVQPAVLDLSRRLVAADAYAIWRLDAAAREWRIVSSAGVSEQYSGHRIPAPDDARGALERPVVAEDVTALPLLAERRQMYESEGVRSLLAAPLRIHGEPCGTLTFYYRRPHKFRETELRVVTALANLAGSAISNAELYEEQSRLRAAAQAAERRSSFLAEASRVLSSSLDYQKTLAQVARLAVPDLADWCAVDLLGEGGAVGRLAVAHVDPSKIEWAHELQRRYPPDPAAPRGLHNVLRTGQSELYPEITDEMLAAAAKDEEHLRVLRDLKFSSVMIVPLAARGRTLGAITFVAESGRRYGPEDLRLCEALSLRAAAAIDNARLYQAAREASRLKDEFLATVSHELRTPLTAIVGWLHLVRTGQMDEAAVGRALETVERNARSQAQLINDLLDVSRIVTGKLHLDVRPVALAAAVDGAITSVRPAADAKRIRISAALDPDLPPVQGDRDRLQQVFWNLLSNAVKFTPEGGRIEVSVRAAGPVVEIEVRDTGQGIPREFLPHVFDRFRQADQSTTRAHGGLGLGLSIVRHLVELHGGSVRAESAGEGLGAAFAVTLPLASALEDTGPAAAARPTDDDDSGTPAASEPSIRLDGLRVLVVDDEPDTRELLKFGLSRCGARVSAASTATEALKAIAEELPEVLISDIGMPEADGYELIRRVRSLPAERGGETPAVALTAYARSEDRQRALKAGYQLHVSKPVELAELVAAVSSLARRGA
jgi:PAS domain S-box-containing protein